MKSLRKQSRITAKYQVTVPKQVREKLKLGASDQLEWRAAEDGRIYVTVANMPIAQYKGAIAVGTGDIQQDIDKARDAIAQRHR